MFRRRRRSRRRRRRRGEGETRMSIMKNEIYIHGFLLYLVGGFTKWEREREEKGE